MILQKYYYDDDEINQLSPIIKSCQVHYFAHINNIWGKMIMYEKKKKNILQKKTIAC